MIYKNEKPAILMFQDGSYFEGIGFGAVKKVSGEITFTTIPGSGYVESLTDPSFYGQIIVYTYTSIGNFGVPEKLRDDYGILKQFESDYIKQKGLIVNEYCKIPSHYESVKTLEDWLIEEDVPGIQWIDTRTITQELVLKGSKLGLIQVCEVGEKPNIEDLKTEVISIENPNDKNLVETVSTKEIKKFSPENSKARVVILDLGVKNNVIRTLLLNSIEAIVIPYNFNYDKIMELEPNGVLLANGPGNPQLYDNLIEVAKNLIENKIPTMGIGLGHTIIGLAAGASCYKMTSEHRGGRTTVESATGDCYITFQNHAYCLKDVEKNGFKEYYHDKDDKTNEGIIHENRPIFSVAFNPEASPGSVDMKDVIFNQFIKFVEDNK